MVLQIVLLLLALYYDIKFCATKQETNHTVLVHRNAIGFEQYIKIFANC